MDKKLFAAIATLTGTIMGAGFLGIPYVVSKSGFAIGAGYILIIGILMLFVRLYFGEVILRTKGIHHLTGYAKMYLGKTWQWLMFFSMFFGIYSALLAYLIGEGQSLSFLFFGHINYTLLFGILFWLSLAFLTYEGLRALRKCESIALIIIIFLVLLISVIYGPNVSLENLTYINYQNFFVPFGVILFSLLGLSVITEMKREMKGDIRKFKKAIFYGSIIPVVFYLIFVFVVLGSFTKVPEIATLALGKIFVLLGVLTMFTAFFALSIVIRDMYRFDFGLSKRKSWFLSSFIPLILFLVIQYFNLASFTQILGAAGIIGGGIAILGILIMFEKAKILGKRQPEYSMPQSWLIIVLIILMYFIGAISSFLF